jgi:hypothetical protein
MGSKRPSALDVAVHLEVTAMGRRSRLGGPELLRAQGTDTSVPIMLEKRGADN